MITFEQLLEYRERYLTLTDEEIKEREEKEKEIRERIVGALAYDLRQDWNDYECRLDEINRLGDHEVTAEMIYEWGCGFDGRYFCNSEWEGPYGGEVTDEELNYFDVIPSIFECRSKDKNSDQIECCVCGRSDLNINCSFCEKLLKINDKYYCLLCGDNLDLRSTEIVQYGEHTWYCNTDCYDNKEKQYDT